MKTKQRPVFQYRVTGFLSGSGISSEIISAASKRSARKKSKFDYVKRVELIDASEIVEEKKAPVRKKRNPRIKY